MPNCQRCECSRWNEEHKYSPRHAEMFPDFNFFCLTKTPAKFTAESVTLTSSPDYDPHRTWALRTNSESTSWTSNAVRNVGRLPKLYPMYNQFLMGGDVCLPDQHTGHAGILDAQQIKSLVKVAAVQLLA